MNSWSWQWILGAAVVASAVGCSSNDGPWSEQPSVSENEGPRIGSISLEVGPNEPVSAAANNPCDSSQVLGLSNQLIEEIQCLKPGLMKRIDNLPGIRLTGAMPPWLQTPAANALIAAQKARGGTISINSALRAIPEQYVLFRWVNPKANCGITAAASPGQSNHESGLAIDINDSAGWRGALQSNGFVWLGSGDVPHYDFKGGGTVALAGLSILAFQRLWNRNHPDDKIEEDSAYGPQTEARLVKSPSGGFPIGAPKVCPPEAEDAGTTDEEEPPPQPTPLSQDAGTGDNGNGNDEIDAPVPRGAGCSAAGGRSPSGSSSAPWMLSLAIATVALRRARRRPGKSPSRW